MLVSAESESGGWLCSTGKSGSFASALNSRSGPPESGRSAEVELTGVAADLIFEDYPVLVGARLLLLRGKTGRTYRDAAGNR